VPDFATAIERLLTRIHHWDEPRWRSAPATPAAAEAAQPSAAQPSAADAAQPSPVGAAQPSGSGATQPPAVGGPSEPIHGAAGTRSELVQGLVQHLADLGAEAENRPARPVPHLHDLVLRDQLRVLADDILAAAPEADLLDRAAAAVNEVRRSL
jgi:hypothetical protein